MAGLLFLKNTLAPRWLRSWILRRSLGVGKVGFGCGRVRVVSVEGFDEEGRMGRGIGEGVGTAEAGDMAIGVGRGLGDSLLFFIFSGLYIVFIYI